jgi:hypothetical protein
MKKEKKQELILSIERLFAEIGSATTPEFDLENSDGTGVVRVYLVATNGPRLTLKDVIGEGSASLYDLKGKQLKAIYWYLLPIKNKVYLSSTPAKPNVDLSTEALQASIKQHEQREADIVRLFLSTNKPYSVWIYLPELNRAVRLEQEEADSVRLVTDTGKEVEFDNLMLCSLDRIFNTLSNEERRSKEIKVFSPTLHDSDKWPIDYYAVGTYTYKIAYFLYERDAEEFRLFKINQLNNG